MKRRIAVDRQIVLREEISHLAPQERREAVLSAQAGELHAGSIHKDGSDSTAVVDVQAGHFTLVVGAENPASAVTPHWTKPFFFLTSSSVSALPRWLQRRSRPRSKERLPAFHNPQTTVIRDRPASTSMPWKRRPAAFSGCKRVIQTSNAPIHASSKAIIFIGQEMNNWASLCAPPERRDFPDRCPNPAGNFPCGTSECLLSDKISRCLKIRATRFQG